MSLCLLCANVTKIPKERALMSEKKCSCLTLKQGKLYLQTISTLLNQSVLLARAKYYWKYYLLPFLALQNPKKIITITLLFFIMIRIKVLFLHFKTKNEDIQLRFSHLLQGKHTVFSEINFFSLWMDLDLSKTTPPLPHGTDQVLDSELRPILQFENDWPR